MSKAKKFFAVLLPLLLMLGSTGALACTGYYVGREVSENGTTIIGHTADSFTTYQSVTYVVPRVENEPGRVYVTPEGIEYPLPETTYRYSVTPRSDGLYDSSAINEMGVAVSASVTTYSSAEAKAMDPNVPGGLSEQFLCDLVGMCAASAREAVELLADYIEVYGNTEQNIILVADREEAWYMETYTGHQWCAVRMPEDCVAVFGNQFMLGAVDPESEDVLCSAGLFSVPEEYGIAVYDEEGNMDLFATYAGGALANYANRRTWYGHFLLAPSTAGEYDTYTRYELFYEPDEKVSLTDIFELTRSRFEGTVWQPEEYDLLNQRVIGVERQMTCHVIEIYPQLPAAMACVNWTCMANAEHSVYLPQSNLITDVAAAYRFIPEEMGVNPDMAHFVFKRLCTLSEQDRVWYGQGVRDYWADVEAYLTESYSDVLKETEKLYETDPEAAEEYITDYTISIQERAFADANRMYDELIWYMIENNMAQKYAYNSATMTMDDTITQIPFEPSLSAETQWMK